MTTEGRRDRGSVGGTVGARVKEVRRARGMSSAELARRSGISKAALSSIEAGAGNPTIATLDAVAVALALPLADLISGAGQYPDPVLVRSTGRADDEVARELIQRLPGAFTVEIWRLRMPPDHLVEGSPHSPGTIESLVVADGHLDAGVVGDQTTIARGDCLSFPGDEPHSYRTGDAPADVTVLIASPQTLVHRPARRRRAPGTR